MIPRFRLLRLPRPIARPSTNRRRCLGVARRDPRVKRRLRVYGR